MLVGCGTERFGANITPDTMSRIRVGQTTKAEVINLLGKPIGQTRDPGLGLDSMVFQARTVKMTSLISTDQTMQTVTVMFDRNGVVYRISNTATDMSVNSFTGVRDVQTTTDSQGDFMSPEQRREFDRMAYPQP
jgi:hypothetical protein